MRRTVFGSSMRPYLNDLDICITEKISAGDIVCGDIVIYDSPVDGDRAVHRVVGRDENGSCLLVKGDNIPRPFTEKIPFDAVKEKVTAVKRSGRTYDLLSRRRRLAARFTAFLSRNDLTPTLLKRRVLDRPLLLLSGSSFYRRARALLYGNISYICTRKGSVCTLYASVAGAGSARADLEKRRDGSVLLRTHIRHRDRNSLFAAKFLEKAVEVAEKEFGPVSEIYSGDLEFRDLLAGGGNPFNTGKVRFI